MTEEALRIDIDRVLAPISGSKEAGEDIRNRNIFTSIRSLRVTEDAQGIIGSAALLPGEARVADWRKVLELCEATLSHRSKDLRIAVWLADAAVRVGGLTGLMDGLRVLAGLHERYWTSMFPLLEDYDLEERAGWIEQCDDLLATAIGGVRIADAGPEYSRSFDDWRRSKVLQEKSSLLKEDDHANEMKKEAEALQQAISIAIARTPEAFYRTLQTMIVDCLYECDALKTVLIDRFSAEYVNAPASVARVATPKFLNTRTTLQECQTLVVQILTPRSGANAQPQAVPEAASSRPMSYAANSRVRMPYDPPKDRAEAISQLESIAQFFQRTEPHSPVAYLVQRAARWGDMSLNDWLEEVVGDSSVLSRIRQTLGVPPEETEKK